MTTFVGDILPGFRYTVTNNSTGALAAPSSFAVVLTAPDNTTPALTVVNSATGVYSVTYVATMAGRYRAVGTAVGNGCDGVDVLEWNVEPVAPSTIVSLDDAKRFLNKSSTGDDPQLEEMLHAVSEVCERFTRRRWRRQTFVEVHSACDADYLHLRNTPVISVSTVVVNGTTVTDYVVDKRAGLLRRGTTTWETDWDESFAGITVTYVAGPVDGVVPANIRQGCLLLLRHMWDTQRGGSGGPRQSGAADEYDPALGIYVPNRVRQAWGEPRILVR